MVTFSKKRRGGQGVCGANRDELYDKFGFTQAGKLEHAFNMKLHLTLPLFLAAHIAIAAQKPAAPAPAPTAQPAALKPAGAVAAPTVPPAETQPRSQAPVMDATAFGMGVGAFGAYSVLGGDLQIGIADWLRLSGGIKGALAGDQPSGSFSFSNYYFLWQFSGAFVFTAPKLYKNIARPYTALELLPYYDAKFKGFGVNGAFKIGIDLYMTQDYSIYFEAGVMMVFTRELTAPPISGPLFNLGARTFF